jgi:hypothetical protein
VKAAVSLDAIGMVIAGASAPPSHAAGRLHVHEAREGDVRAELSYREGPPNRFWSGRTPLQVLQLDVAVLQAASDLGLTSDDYAGNFVEDVRKLLRERGYMS